MEKPYDGESCVVGVSCPLVVSRKVHNSRKPYRIYAERSDLAVKLRFVGGHLKTKASCEAVFIWLAASSRDLGINTLKSLCNIESVLSHPNILILLS